ncbi:MAG TPA: lytic transglycosylase domain-containing protein [Candidatus Angelobacter sp.]|jgi:soluble lytic murein transglycosylase-like protein|nr:lytic transglycosylase domain-containing protein [Candidatus Angelobacter sp.]
MKLSRTFTVGAVLVLAQLSAFAGEVAILRNGFSIHFDRKEQSEKSTRLFTATGYMDIANDQITSFEEDEKPIVTEPPPTTAPATPLASPASVNKPRLDKALAKPLLAAQPATVSKLTASPPAATAAFDLDQVIREASSRNRLDPDFVSSVIRAESNFKTHAISKKGAQGLMQLMPATAAQLGVADAFDPKANVEAGTAHLSALLDRYHNDPIKALAAYNAGAHRVKQYNGVPPYRETRAYVSKIVRDFNAKKRAQMKADAATNASTPAKAAGPKAVKKPKPQQASVPKSASPA